MREVCFQLRGLSFGGIEWGDPVGIPTILLHGFLDHAGSWEKVAERLPGWRVAIDHRGHGRSAHQGPGTTYFFSEYVADLDALVAALGGRVRLVGHSMGGTLATMYAGARPDSVVAMASLDGLGMYHAGPEFPDRLVAFLDGVRTPPTIRSYPSIEAAAGKLRASYPSIDSAWALRLAERGTVPTEGGVVWAYDPRHKIRGSIPYRHDHHIPMLERIRCPVLSIHPEHSPFRSEDVTTLERAIPSLRVVTVPAVGHMLHLEAPMAIASAITAFFAGEPSPSP